MTKKEDSTLSMVVRSQRGKVVTFGEQIAGFLNITVYSTMKVILHNCTEMFIAASKKPKRFACINQYRFSSFEVVSIEGDGSWPRSELQRVKHS